MTTAPILRILLALLPLLLPLHAADRPNVLLCIADDASWHHFSINGDPVCRTPNFDRIAREGVNFRHSFCSSPSCTPSRGALLTGQHFWRLEDGANLWSRWPNKFAVYPDLLAKAGYHTGLKGKGWGPGDFTTGGRTTNPAGPGGQDFAAFLKNKPADKPFCFWFGSTDPHRLYERGSGLKSGLKLEDVKVPPYLPDTPAVRSDILDYYFEVQRFDRDVGAMVKLLEESGQLDNTLIIITSDNGWPFPRGKATCYDAGVRMPLAIRWPSRIPGGRTVDDFVTHPDLAPTILEAAGLPVPPDMTGRSLLPLLTSGKSGLVEPSRDKAFFGRERHAYARAGNLSYPIRAIRTADFLYLRNYEADRWPAGDPPLYGDVDQHTDIIGSPSKQAVIEHPDTPAAQRLFDLAFAKRPLEELYDLRSDPWQMTNVAADGKYAAARQKLHTELNALRTASKDPRIGGNGATFDKFHYVTVAPNPAEPAAKAAARGRQFLVNLIDPELHLLPEFPGHSVYWLYHDNYLAAKVLASSHPDKAAGITAAIKSFGVERSGKIELLFGEAKLPIRNFELKDVEKREKITIRTEVATDKENTAAAEYADLLFFTAIAQPDAAKARASFDAGIAMWDGTGFNDTATRHFKLYATYKLALALRAARRFQLTTPPLTAIQERLLTMQAPSGGWITDYTPGGNPNGKANVETTSLAILALDPPADPKSKP